MRLRLILLSLALQRVWGGALPIPASGVYLGIWADPNLAGSQEQSIEIREGSGPNGINHPFSFHLVY
jgi:hypothetical protein